MKHDKTENKKKGKEYEKIEKLNIHHYYAYNKQFNHTLTRFKDKHDFQNYHMKTISLGTE